MSSSDQLSKVEVKALHLHDELWLDTILFFRNSRGIYRRFDDWKDIDRFYFVPLKLSMTYCIGGHSISMSDGTVYLGTFIRNTIEHPDLFSFKCPHCGETLYPYGYNGSPLSGRVDLQAICDCGWSGFEMVSGWRIRSEALKAAQHSDTWRRRLFKLKSGTTSTIYDLLDWPHKE